jgi:hypothetical protein
MENIFDKYQDFLKNKRPNTWPNFLLSITIADENNQVAFAQGVVKYVAPEDFVSGKEIERSSEQFSTKGSPPVPLASVALNNPDFTTLDVTIYNNIFANEFGCSLESNGKKATCKLIDNNGILSGTGESIFNPSIQASYSITYSFWESGFTSGEISGFQKQEIVHH